MSSTNLATQVPDNAPDNAPENAPENESRVERKRRLARERIIRSAEALMRTQPIDEVTVGQITEAADVGHGTFYLHFKSKRDVLIPITREMAREWDDIMQEGFDEGTDPAEVVGRSSRYMGRAVNADPLWRWMLKDSGVPIDDIREAVGRFALRDFTRGFRSGRFSSSNPSVMEGFLGGGFVACLLSSFESATPEVEIDHMVEFLLRTLGVSQEDAARIAHAPLPPISFLPEQ